MGFFTNVLSGGKEAKRKSLVSEANSYIQQIQSNKSIPTVGTKIMLENGESAFIEEETNLSETRAIRKSGGGFAGFRVAKGVTLGGYSGTSESHQEWRTVDHGIITLTNKRFIFDGSKGSNFFPIKKIMKVNVSLDGIQISLEGKSKDMIFSVENPYIWGTLLNIVKRVENPLDLSNVNLDIQLK